MLSREVLAPLVLCGGCLSLTREVAVGVRDTHQKQTVERGRVSVLFYCARVRSSGVAVAGMAPVAGIAAPDWAGLTGFRTILWRIS